MAFIPRLSWHRSAPPLYVVEGRFEVVAEYYHHPKLVTKTRDYCERINSGRFFRNKQRGDV